MTSHHAVASDADDHNTAAQQADARDTSSEVTAMRFDTCTVCSGTGTDPNTNEKCDNCDGKGRTD